MTTLIFAACFCLAATARADTIPVQSPLRLPDEPIACERIPVGITGDYKPCVARMPGGELLMVAFREVHQGAYEQIILFRSHDGGRTWSQPEMPDLPGREPYLTVLPDGTILLTVQLLPADPRNHWGHCCGYIDRSVDDGRTWQSIRVEAGANDFRQGNTVSRNVLRLDDGTLLLGVDYWGPTGGPNFLWRSADEGRTWDRKQAIAPKDFCDVQYGFFGGETWMWPAKSGKIYAIVRVDSAIMPIRDRPIVSHNDQDTHDILYSSADQGRTFQRVSDFGDYGEMYMSILRLQDKRLLLTFTVRSMHPPLGVRSIPGIETPDGFQFDFSHDRVMLDTKTPVRLAANYKGGPFLGSGGGFGPTVQLDDGTLVTSYSYRGEDAQTHLEVVRWRLPPAR